MPTRTFSMPPRWLPLAAAAILLAGGGFKPAHASYIVITNAQTNISSVITAVADYNLLATGSTFTTSNGGNVGATTTSSGTVDATGTLTSSTDQALVSYTTTGTQSGSVFSAADLAAGTLKASNVNDSVGSVSSHTYAEFSDVLHYTIANATDSTITDVTVQFALDGTFSAQNGALGIVTWNMGFGGAHLNTLIQTDPTNCAATYPNPCIYVQTDPGWVSSSASFTSDTPGSIIFSARYAIQGASADIPVTGYLEIANGGGASSSFDYSRTSHFILPGAAGVSYTSDSGVFLTENATAPEPASIFLIGLGAVALGLVRRRRLNP